MVLEQLRHKNCVCLCVYEGPYSLQIQQSRISDIDEQPLMHI